MSTIVGTRPFSAKAFPAGGGRKRLPRAVLALCTLLMAQPSAALLIEPIFIGTRAFTATQSADLVRDSKELIDGIDVVAGQSLESIGNYKTNADIESRAFQNADGISTLKYDGISFGGTNRFYYNDVTALITYRITNDTAEQARVDFDFSLSNMSMKFFGVDQTGNPFTATTGIDGSGGLALRFRIYEAGGSVFGDPITPTDWAANYGAGPELYGADFEAWMHYLGDYSGYSIETGRNRTFTPHFVEHKDPDSPFVSSIDINFDGIQDSISLGVLDPGESTKILVGARIEVLADDYEPIFKATFNDPNGVTPTFRSTPANASQVPAPAAI